MLFRVFMVLAACGAFLLPVACRHKAPGKRITVLLPAATALRAGDDVFINGVDVGDVLRLAVRKRRAAVDIGFDERFAPAITSGVAFQVEKREDAAGLVLVVILPEIAGRELPEGAVVEAVPTAAETPVPEEETRDTGGAGILSRVTTAIVRIWLLADEMRHGREARQLARAFEEYYRWFLGEIGMGEKDGQ